MKTKIIKFILSPFEKEIERLVNERIDKELEPLATSLSLVSKALSNCMAINNNVSQSELSVSKMLVECKRIEALVRQLYYSEVEEVVVNGIKGEGFEQKDIDFKFEVLPSIEDIFAFSKTSKIDPELPKHKTFYDDAGIIHELTFNLHDKDWKFINLDVSQNAPIGSIPWAFYQLSIGNKILYSAPKKESIVYKLETGALSFDGKEQSAELIYRLMFLLNDGLVKLSLYKETIDLANFLQCLASYDIPEVSSCDGCYFNETENHHLCPRDVNNDSTCKDKGIIYLLKLNFDLSNVELVPAKNAIDGVSQCTGCFFHKSGIAKICPSSHGNNKDCEPNLIYVKKGGSK